MLIIADSPCVGKTAVTRKLFTSYDNSALFDGDWAWCVNPFSADDPRLRMRRSFLHKPQKKSGGRSKECPPDLYLSADACTVIMRATNGNLFLQTETPFNQSKGVLNASVLVSDNHFKTGIKKRIVICP